MFLNPTCDFVHNCYTFVQYFKYPCFSLAYIHYYGGVLPIFLSVGQPGGPVAFNAAECDAAYIKGLYDGWHKCFFFSKNGQFVAFTYSQAPPNCSIWNWYWISWKDGCITVGNGNQVGLNVLIFFDDSLTPITVRSMNVGVYPYGSSSTVLWTVPAMYYNVTRRYLLAMQCYM